MNRSILISAGIDYDSGVRRFAGRARLYEKSLSKFPGEGTFARIRADYATGDVEQLLLDAHEFKGMCGNIAMQSLSQAADALVGLLRAGGSREALDGAYTALEAKYNDTVDAVLAAAEAEL